MTPNFEEILVELSYRIPTGIVDLTNEEHLDELVIILEENRIYNSQAIIALREKAKVKPNAPTKKVLNKIKPNSSSNPKAGESPKFKGYFHIGGGYYSKQPGGEITHKSDAGSLRVLNAKEKAEKNKGAVSNTKKSPTVKANNDIEVSGAEERLGKSDKKGAKGSFRDALFSTIKKSKDEDKEKFINDKAIAAQKVVAGLMDSSGNINLLSDTDGKPTKINGKNVQKVLDKLFKGQPISAKEAETFNSVVKIVTNPENGDVKLYFAKKIAGRHPQQGYDKVEFPKNNVPMGDALRKYAIENGLTVGKSGEGAVGKKQINPNKQAKAANPKEPIKNLNVKSDKNGIGINNKRFNYRPIPTKADIAGLKKSLIKKGDSDAVADEKIRLLVNSRKKDNQVLSTIAEVAAKSGGEIPYCNFGDVFTPEGRRATITNIIKGATKSFSDDLKKHQSTFGTENLLEKPENATIFDTLGRLEKISKSSNLENDKKAQSEFKKEVDQLLIDMAASVDFKDAVADFAEMTVGLEQLAKGRRVLFPSSENFQTADIIILPNDDSISDAELLSVSVEEVDLIGGVSIKSDGGGGSAMRNRIELTEYKEPETKEKLLNAQVTYQIAYGNQQDVNEKELAKAENMIEDLFKYGVSKGCFTKEEIKTIKKIGEKAGQSEIKTAGKAGNCGGPENQKRLHRAIILQHIQLQLACIISNHRTDYTLYSNVNKKMGKSKGKVVKVTDDIADGIKKPCYSNPHHNPGYTKSEDKNGCISLTPTNQNPAHIVSKMPDLINNYKE
jgi:hypothetical protein